MHARACMNVRAWVSECGLSESQTNREDREWGSVRVQRQSTGPTHSRPSAPVTYRLNPCYKQRNTDRLALSFPNF